MNTAHPMHQFADATTAHVRGLQSNDCQLVIRQPPVNARVAVGKEKDRKPVDPPPIVQLKISAMSDPAQNYLQSPYFFMSCNLVATTEGEGGTGTLGASLAGTLVSSLHRLKDVDNKDGAFFVFGDLSVKIEGKFLLQFNLYEMRDEACFHVQSVQSSVFTVHGTKNFPGMTESTFLTRSFSDQGVRLRLRKEPRTLLRKRGPASEDYVPRHYSRRQQSQGERIEQQSGDGDESPEISRHSQSEQSGSMHSQQMNTSPYDQRPQMGRGYSQQSSGSFGSYHEEQVPKRPRTGSEQSHSQPFGQQRTSLESPQYQNRIYTDPQQSSYSLYPQQSPQQQPYGYSYTQSPQATNASSRDNHFAQRINVQQGDNSPFSPAGQRSPASAYFPPQPQAQYQQTQFGGSQIVSPSPTHSVHTALGGMGIVDRSQMSPGMGGPGMAAPVYGRMNTTPAYTLLGDRRDIYGVYTGQNHNFPAGTMGGGMLIPRTSGTAISTTNAPGTMEASYH